MTYDCVCSGGATAWNNVSRACAAHHFAPFYHLGGDKSVERYGLAVDKCGADMGKFTGKNGPECNYLSHLKDRVDSSGVQSRILR